MEARIIAGNGHAVESLGDCRCGCGYQVNSPKSIYRPGHDARHVSKLHFAVVVNGLPMDDALMSLPTQALRWKLKDAYQRQVAKSEAKVARTLAKLNAKAVAKQAEPKWVYMVGRWSYPAILNVSRGWEYNNKRDGSGDWVAVEDESKLVCL